jgi:hypothetical protein
MVFRFGLSDLPLEPPDNPNEHILEIAAKKRSPTLRCVMCGAPTAGTYYPYCPDCYKKSLDPKGGVPPIPIIIDPLKQME